MKSEKIINFINNVGCILASISIFVFVIHGYVYSNGFDKIFWASAVVLVTGLIMANCREEWFE